MTPLYLRELTRPSNMTPWFRTTEGHLPALAGYYEARAEGQQAPKEDERSICYFDGKSFCYGTYLQHYIWSHGSYPLGERTLPDGYHIIWRGLKEKP